MDVWYECTSCSFATNSQKSSWTHELETGHKVNESDNE